MKYIVDHIPKSTPYKRRQGLSMKAEYITIHNTGNEKSTARNERDWLTNPTNKRQASFHIAVDDIEAIECIPLNENAWHSGDGLNGTGNRKSIGIEICESGNYAKTLDNAVELVAKMLLERGWGIDRLRRHFDWSKKICPRKMYDSGTWKGWFSFLNQVDQKINELKNGDDERLKLQEYQWNMLVDKLKKCRDDGEFSAEQWVDKALNRTLTVSDLVWLHFIIDDKM
ncbi:peptidoglycan recognition protein family protein [Schinkia azotoformans]|uniref:peptidoglycan recognition protein family protein n=1 Tax=Schinkia azotoformans TaxID=1454 RepID=UPI002DB58589|nr:N-acetylmuramoyl-L-alanine amidase [Schinkia azotoformans]MEC1757355.1 N-acetylmuramoyl-L-alanine amidase [Schinkia azotoformans]